MKRGIVVGTVSLMFMLSISMSARQKPANFSGTWLLDVSKSKLDERARIESMSMTVTQTEKEIRIDSKTVRSPRPEGSQAGTGGGGGFGRGGGFGNGSALSTYSLDGKEITIEEDSSMGKIPVKMKAKLEGGKLTLSSSRTTNGANGIMTAAITEAWAMSDDRNTLTIVREQISPRGTNTSTMVFVKK